MSRNETEFPMRDTNSTVNLDTLPGDTGNPRQSLMSARIASDIYCAVEAMALFATGLLVAFVHVRLRLGLEHFLDMYIWPLSLLPLTYALLAQRSGMYEIAALCRLSRMTAKVITSLMGAFVAIALLGLALGVASGYSRLWFVAWLLSSLAVLWLLRVLAAMVFARWYQSGVLRKRVAILGAGKPLANLLQRLAQAKNDAEVVGLSHLSDMSDAAVTRDCTQLIAHARRHEPEAVIIALPLSASELLPRIVMQLRVLPAEISLYPDYPDHSIMLRSLGAVGTAQLVNLQHRPIDGWGRVIKAVEDYSLALIALILTAPLMLLAALAIKLDSPGPVFFRQPRNGLNNQIFQMYKFRTMGSAEGKKAFAQVKANDGRVTRVGRWLRRFSIDELPQLINVLRGEMSMVGPRPHPADLNRQYAGVFPLYSSRHRMKPGITGWAQVNDHRGPTRNAEQMLRRMECDLYYIDNWSIWFDLSIIAATPFISIFHKNAI